LFASSSSVERKHWGFLLLAKVFSEAPEIALEHVMTPNTVSCLQNQLKADSRYLQRSAQKAIQAIHARIAKQNDLAPLILRGMLVDAGALQFDTTTKTKTIEKLVTVEDNRYVCDFLGELFQKPRVGNGNEAVHARKTIADLLATACLQKLARHQGSHAPGEASTRQADIMSHDKSTLVLSRHAIEVLVEIAFFRNPAAAPDVSNASRLYVRERIMVCLERALKDKATGHALLQHTTAYLVVLERKGLCPAFDLDDNIMIIISDARRRLESISSGLCADVDKAPNHREHRSENRTSSSGEDSDSDSDSDKGHSLGFKSTPAHGIDRTCGNGILEAITLLYHLALLQVHGGEPDAVSMVDDLNAYHDSLAEDDKSFMGSDILVEVLLTFASKPSKFLRKISLQAFASFSAQITQEGLQSLIRVLDTTENLQGQVEMFDTAESEDSDENDIDGPDSDMEMDSDVEEISDPAAAPSEDSSDPESDDEDAPSGEAEDDDELAAFDAMLAAALGTRKGEEDLAAGDTAGSDDEAMSDSEMEALDEKLTAVFRARKDLAKPKKKEHKDAKENIVNFKNRVLDLVDVYLKQEHAHALSLQLVLPLLRLARRTNTKQLADRACSILREFNSRCKGAAKLPPLLGKGATAAALDTFREIHREAGLPGSNAHASACSSASILLVRVLWQAGVGPGRLWAVYAATGTKMLEDKDCHVQAAFFTDWNNWCANARKGLAK
jgi:DNA polymerase phi